MKRIYTSKLTDEQIKKYLENGGTLIFKKRIRGTSLQIPVTSAACSIILSKKAILKCKYYNQYTDSFMIRTEFKDGVTSEVWMSCSNIRSLFDILLEKKWRENEIN